MDVCIIGIGVLFSTAGALSVILGLFKSLDVIDIVIDVVIDIVIDKTL
jgi:hypothetical protein